VRLESELTTRWSEKDVEAAATALAAFCSEDVIVGTKSAAEALEKSGIMALPAGLRHFLFASIAESMLGAFWYGIRTATQIKPDGTVEMTQYDPNELRKRAEQTCELFRMPAWRRKAKILWIKALRVFGRSA